MSASQGSRTTGESLVHMTEIVLPEDSNVHGSIFGGRVLALVDKCAAAVAMRHARCRVVTLRLDSVEFRNPVRVGDILILDGRINAAFGTSMEIEVDVHSENPLTGDRTLTTRAFVTLVAVDGKGGTCRVPTLVTRTDAERERAEAALRRREARLAGRG